ncbi:MAG: hypothetical protein K1X67_23610 [Fimbriimonadaceae bacterium]|nr:hypothetical protein [Fimbriimonadaceae bacterium]
MVCLLALAGTLTVDAVVTVQADALTTRALVQALASQSGQKLECDGLLAKEPLCVDFEGQPLEDVMTNLALVVGGEWKEDRGIRTLTRTSKVRKQLQDEQAKSVAETFSNMMKKAKAEVDKLPPFDQATAKRDVDTRWLNELDQAAFTQANRQVSMTNLAYRTGILLIDRIGPASLAQMAVGARIVYTDLPTKVQTPFPKGCAPLLKGLLDGAALMLQEKRVLGNAPVSRFGEMPQIGTGDLAQYKKSLFAVRRNSQLSFTFELAAFDAAGDTIIECEWRHPSASVRLAGALPGKGEPLVLTDRLKNLSNLTSDVGAAWASGRPYTRPDGSTTSLSNYMSMSESQKMPGDWGVGAIISDPVKNEPLGYVFGPLMRQAAKAVKKPMIASVSDGTLFSFCQGLNMGAMKTADDVLALLAQSHVPEEARVPFARVISSDDWLLVRPAQLLSAQAARFDRMAARDFMQAIKAKGGAQFEDTLAYVRKSGMPAGFASLDVVLISHANPSVEASSVTRMLNSPMELLMRLDGFGNDKATFARLTPEARAVIEQWVYSDPSFRRELGGGFPGAKRMASEPTEVFPNGIPPDTEIEISTRRDHALVGTAESGYVFSMQPEDFAWHESMGGKSPFGGEDRPPRKFVSFRAAQQRDVTVKVHFSESLVTTRTLREVLPVAGSAFGPYDALPKDLKERINEARAAMKARG